MWYKNGIPRIKKYHLAWYDMTRDGSCFDESFFKPDEVDKIMPYVETVEDEGKNDRSKVFVHFDDGDMYELKLVKVNKNERQHGYFDEHVEDDEFDDYEDDYDPYENEMIKFIWGCKVLG